MTRPELQFGAIIGQKVPVGILRRMVMGGAVPHALLFSGIEGVGRQAAALAFAAALNCRNIPEPGAREWRTGPESESIGVEPCGTCRPCKKIAAGAHPDVLTIPAENGLIRIARVRSLGHALTMKPFEGRVRVILMPEAAALTPEAGNALLKALEEPPERTVFILIAERASDLLPTIVSRCQPVRFYPISGEALKDHLVRNLNVDPESAAVAAAMAGGSRTRAETLSNPGWIEKRNRLLAALTGGRLSSTGGILSLAKSISGDKEQLTEAVDVISAWLRDAAVARYLPGRSPDARPDGAGFTFVLRGFRAAQQARRRLAGNPGLRLVAEELLLTLAGICPENDLNLPSAPAF